MEWKMNSKLTVLMRFASRLYFDGARLPTLNRTSLRGSRVLAMCVLMACVMATFSAPGALDYFAVADKSNAKVFVFTYDTETHAFAYVAGVATTMPSDTQLSVKALPGHGFIAGASAGGASAREGVEVFTTADKLAWTSELRVDMRNKAGSGEFFDTNIRAVGSSTDPGAVSAAMLKDGRIFITDARSQPSTSKYYGLGNVAELTGDVSAIFPLDSDHLGSLAHVSAADNSLFNVTSTIEGTAERFAIVSWHTGTGAGNVMVYNGVGTFKGYLTRLGSNTRHSVGHFKQTAWGDLILQVDGSRADPSTTSFNARWVDDAQWDTQKFTFTLPNVKGTGTLVYFIEPRSIDGLESGRIVVLGETRGGGGDYLGVWVFASDDNGVTWAPTTTNPVNLRTVSGAPSNINAIDIAGLYTASGKAGTTIIIR
jgi:hypothetical protein